MRLYLDTLAAAHAEVCEFELAAQRQSQALELVPDELLADEFRYRLRLYQSKRNPYNFGPFDWLAVDATTRAVIPGSAVWVQYRETVGLRGRRLPGGSPLLARAMALGRCT